MIPPPRREGYLSTLLRERMERERRVVPQSAPGILTSRTSGGVIRRPLIQRRGRGGEARDTWA